MTGATQMAMGSSTAVTASQDQATLSSLNAATGAASTNNGAGEKPASHANIKADVFVL